MLLAERKRYLWQVPVDLSRGFLQADGGQWKAEVAIRQEAVQVEGWALPHLPPLITDILLSLDDKWLYFSNWLRGDVCQYDIR